MLHVNRNVESHFSQLPSAEIQRSTFDRSCSYKTSLNSSRIVPFMIDEVLPGDTFDITTSKVVRSQTLLTPLMDNMYLDTYYFFVPNRLVWKHWREFCGENTSGPWAPTVEYTIPKIIPPAGGFASGTLADYMGLPVGVEWKADDELAPSALPFRGLALIMNEFFRDENLSDPLLIPMDDANQQGSNGDNYISDVANGGMPFRAAKYHDYFTSALPSPQKGEAVGVPITVPGFKGGTFPVTTGTLPSSLSSEPVYPLITALTAPTSDASNVFSPQVFNESKGVLSVVGSGDSGEAIVWEGSRGTTQSHRRQVPINLQTVIPPAGSGDDSTVNFSVNELRLAFAYQRFLESLARSGSRYTELLLGLFGVRSPDARLQRPEYLGGNRVPINVSEVTNNAQSEQDFLGDLGAKSTTSDVNHDFVKSFTEHGYLFGLMVIRYDHSYSQGLARFWSRSTFTDFYNPKFAHLGEVPIYKAEIYASPETIKSKSNVFGYQEIWADYRYKPNMVTGEMRPGVKNSLGYWNLADYYDKEPTLSDEWIREDVANVDRALAVTSAVSNQFWADIYISNKCTRCMPMYSVPGLIDHF
ncbi:MAG: major capsid protein [Microviridae sp.]|nr:MAG: major capsid protein [Microviridae sp.]